MKLFSIFNRKNKEIAQLLNKGASEEAQNDLEAAYETYKQAASLGSGKAMVAIGSLYAVKGFRMVEQTNIEELLQKGIPVFPWNVIRKTVPDLKAALEWYCKAAKQGEAAGYAAAGVILCEGSAGSYDLDTGIAYLKKAVSLGIEEVRPAISVYAQAKDTPVSDGEYEKMLCEFIRAVEEGKPERYALYHFLKGGTDKQKTRLGHALITRRNLNDPKYADFKYLFSSDNVPLIPCCARRLSWKTFIRIDLNAFPSDDVLITFTSDIRSRVAPIGRLKPAGSAVYRSPAFGWLKEEKEAIVFQIQRQSLPDAAEMEQFVEENHLMTAEYSADNIAFLVEDGEKEYSVEIAAISNGKVQILFRYTIGGSDRIENTFEPELTEFCPTQA